MIGEHSTHWANEPVNEPYVHYCLTIEKKKWIHTFSRDFSTTWNPNSFVQNSKSIFYDDKLYTTYVWNGIYDVLTESIQPSNITKIK